MRKSSLSIAAIMAAAAGMLAGAGMSVGTQAPAGQVLQVDGTTYTSANKQTPAPRTLTQRIAEAAFLRSTGGGKPSRRTFPGYGWPVAHDRRMARKARDKAKHRARSRS